MTTRRRIAVAAACAMLPLVADQVRPTPFDGSTWRLVSVTAGGRTVPAPVRGAPRLVTFEGGSTFRSEICNQQDGRLLRLGSVYVVLEEFSTLMLCTGPLGVADGVVASGWPTMWSVRGDELRLRNKTGALTFVRHLTPDRP